MIIDITLVENIVEENGNQPFFCGGKWSVEENGISFLEENGTARPVLYLIACILVRR